MRFPVAGYAISGKAGSGKSTLGKHLQNALLRADFSSERTAFGDALKEEVAQLYGLTKADPGGRAKLIQHGEERRLENARHWIDRLTPRLDAALVAGFVAIVDDVRFHLELDWARKRGLTLVRLEAPPAVRAARLKADGNEAHHATSGEAGETALDGHLHRFDVVYWDDGNLDLATVATELVTFEIINRDTPDRRRRLPELTAETLPDW